MIPLNKPFTKISKSLLNVDNHFKEVFLSHFKGYNFDVVYSSRQALFIFYKYLYQLYGSLTVAVSPLTCFEALYPIVFNKHKLKFIDISEETLNLSEDLLINEDQIDAVQLIYQGGNPNRMDVIKNWARIKNKIIIEDCAQALGSRFDDRYLGTWGDFSVFSLNKNVYSPLGAIYFTQKKLTSIISFDELSFSTIAYKRIKQFFESKLSFEENLSSKIFKMLLRVSENQTKAIINSTRINKSYQNKLLADFKYLPDIINKRIKNANFIIENVDFTKYRIQKVLSNSFSNRNRLLFISKKLYACEIISKLRQKGIAANNLIQSYLSGFQSKIYEDHHLKNFAEPLSLPCYNKIFDKIFAVPISPALNQDELKHIITTLNDLR